MKKRNIEISVWITFFDIHSCFFVGRDFVVLVCLEVGHGGKGVLGVSMRQTWMVFFWIWELGCSGYSGYGVPMIGVCVCVCVCLYHYQRGSPHELGIATGSFLAWHVRVVSAFVQNIMSEGIGRGEYLTLINELISFFLGCSVCIPGADESTPGLFISCNPE